MKKILTVVFGLIIAQIFAQSESNVWANTTVTAPQEQGTKKVQKPKLLQEEKENELLDYSNIQKVLDRDGLVGHRKEKVEKVKKIKAIKKKLQIAKYAYPKQEDFWSFMSEYWLVKNAQSLQWDSSRPAYGIKEAFKNLLEKLGYFKQSFKVLIVNSPDITHVGLPSNNDEMILLISLPFMRTLDLTKVDISLLLLEDFFRIRANYFIANIKANKDFLGQNFHNDKMKIEYLQKISENYNDIIFASGFSFQQQYKVTTKMDQVLKSTPELWSAYVKLLNKIDRLVKSNLLYKNYNNIYPSPELQIKWLTPKKSMI